MRDSNPGPLASLLRHLATSCTADPWLRWTKCPDFYRRQFLARPPAPSPRQPQHHLSCRGPPARILLFHPPLPPLNFLSAPSGPAPFLRPRIIPAGARPRGFLPPLISALAARAWRRSVSPFSSGPGPAAPSRSGGKALPLARRGCRHKGRSSRATRRAMVAVAAEKGGGVPRHLPCRSVVSDALPSEWSL